MKTIRSREKMLIVLIKTEKNCCRETAMGMKKKRVFNSTNWAQTKRKKAMKGETKNFLLLKEQF